MLINKDIYYMQLALQEAHKAFAIGEVPVGAVVVKDEKVLAVGHNRREVGNNPIAHAEMEAIAAAAAACGTWRLDGCTLYVTLEPCPMCAGAIINARIARVVYAALDEKAGALGSVCNLAAMPFTHHPQITRGLLAEEAGALLQLFFKQLRG